MYRCCYCVNRTLNVTLPHLLYLRLSVSMLLIWNKLPEDFNAVEKKISFKSRQKIHLSLNKVLIYPLYCFTQLSSFFTADFVCYSSLFVIHFVCFMLYCCLYFHVKHIELPCC